MSPFKNIVLIGRGGVVGRSVLAALLAEPSFTVTILQRESSKTPPSASDPASLRTIRIADDYPPKDLEAAFTGQDAVVNCIGTFAIGEQRRIIDAAVAAGVRRYVPSEYGVNNLHPAAAGLNPVFAAKAEVQKYLRELSSGNRIEWTAFSCGSWIKWSLDYGFLGVHVRERTATLYDGGETLFSIATEENTGLAVARALSRFPEETRNRNVFLSDFAVSQRQVVDEIERQMGGGKNKFFAAVETVDSFKVIDEARAAVDAGGDGVMAGMVRLVEIGVVAGRYGGHLEEEGDEIMNERLGLPKTTLQEVVADALKSMGLK